MRHSISHQHTEQQLPKTMPYSPGCDRTANTILQMALHNSNGLAILSDLAATIGNLLAADLCIVIAAESDVSQPNRVVYWQSKNEINEIADTTLQQLSYLPLTKEESPSGFIESSPLYDRLDRLIQDNFLGKVWRGISTQSQQRTNGLILLLKSASNWTEAEQELPEELTNAIAIAISQAQLQQQSQIKSRYQNLLNHLSQKISLSYQPQSLFQSCLAEIGRTLELDRSMILKFKYQNPMRAKDRDRDSVKGTAKITCVWSADEDLNSIESSFSLSHSSLCQKAWRNAPDCLYLDSNSAFPDLKVDPIATQGNALIMIPIMGRKTSETDSPMVMGLLVLQSNLPRFWSKDELDLINWVGIQMSTAISHEQTRSRVQLLVDERTAHLKSSIDMQGMLSVKMRQHIEQLQRVNQLKDDFMNSMSHELKTPLTSMKMAIKMLRQPNIPPEMRERYLDILEQEWNREYSLIEDLLTLQQLESGELDYRPQELDLSKTIADLSHSFQTKWSGKRDLNLVCKITPPDLKIHTDADSLKHIIKELLSNAGKYCDAGTDIKMCVSSQIKAKQSEILISVSNIGAGITSEELPYIFDKFRRGQGVTDRAVPGTGLGLTLVQCLVEHLNGKIDVESQPLDCDGATFSTTFTLKLPQIQPSIA